MAQKEKKDLIGGILKKELKSIEFDLPLFRFAKERKNSSFLFSSKRKGVFFSVNDWDGRKTFRQDVFIDGLFSSVKSPERIFEYSVKSERDAYLEMRERYADIKNYWLDLFQDSVQGVSLVRAWNVSLISSVIFGMFLMTMIYRYLGQGAAAKIGAVE